MSLNRTAARVTPVLLRGGARAFRRTPRAHRDIPAIAILIPHRFSSTETSTSGGGANFPPPGFNAEQAKKPLPKEQQKTTSQDKSVSEAKDESSTKDPEKPDTVKEATKAPRDGATSTPKTKTAEDQSLSELAAEKAAADKAEDKKVAEKKKEDKKLTIWQKIKKEVAHYWDGTKLLATEVRISSKLALKMAAGYELTRRENRQVKAPSASLDRAIADSGTLAPKNRSGPRTAGSILGLRHRALRRAASPCCPKAFPQSPTEYVRGSEEQGCQGDKLACDP